jgi:protein-tyrosine phosphatase
MNTEFRKENNVRELGGYETKDGRHVKHGLFWRTGAPGNFNEEEMKALKDIHLKTIVDFRSSYEVENLPDPELPGVNYLHVSAITDEAGNEVDLSPEGMKQISEEEFYSEKYQLAFLDNFYGRMPFSPAYRLLFNEIRASRVPLLFHCTAGKDRTGVGAMLILLALNVDEKTIIEDYLKTNVYRKKLVDALMESRKDVIARYPFARYIFQSMEGVSQEAIECSMKKIKERCGDNETYFKEFLHLDHGDLEDLCRKYTE